MLPINNNKADAKIIYISDEEPDHESLLSEVNINSAPSILSTTEQTNQPASNLLTLQRNLEISTANNNHQQDGVSLDLSLHQFGGDGGGSSSTIDVTDGGTGGGGGGGDGLLRSVLNNTSTRRIIIMPIKRTAPDYAHREFTVGESSSAGGAAGGSVAQPMAAPSAAPSQMKMRRCAFHHHHLIPALVLLLPLALSMLPPIIIFLHLPGNNAMKLLTTTTAPKMLFVFLSSHHHQLHHGHQDAPINSFYHHGHQRYFSSADTSPFRPVSINYMENLPHHQYAGSLSSSPSPLPWSTVITPRAIPSVSLPHGVGGSNRESDTRNNYPSGRGIITETHNRGNSSSSTQLVESLVQNAGTPSAFQHLSDAALAWIGRLNSHDETLTRMSSSSTTDNTHHRPLRASAIAETYNLPTYFADDSRRLRREPQNIDACGICLEDYVHGEELGRLDCAHKYHLSCIRQWLLIKNRWPVCKKMALTIIDLEDDE
ncbi:hypothetical protein HN51_006730 [Arachis hypogaea]